MSHQFIEEIGAFPTYIATFRRPWEVLEELPTGEWNMIANGRLFTMDITAVTGRRFSANFSSGDIVDGSWNAERNEIVFRRFIAGQLDQKYTGYLMNSAKPDRLRRIAGTFYQENLDTTAGWYMVKPK